MKHLILSIAVFILCSVPIYAQDSHNGQNRTGTILCRYPVSSGKPQRLPVNVDLLLIIGEDDVTIRFNGDFGTGTYLLTDATSGYTISNTIEAYAGDTEVISFAVDETTSFEFTIEFEDGSWCELSWN